MLLNFKLSSYVYLRTNGTKSIYYVAFERQKKTKKQKPSNCIESFNPIFRGIHFASVSTILFLDSETIDIVVFDDIHFIQYIKKIKLIKVSL